MSVKFRVLALVLAAAWVSAMSAQDRIADLRSRLAHEPNPVAKAKLMPPLGDAEFAAIDDDIAQGKIPEAIEVLKSYRDEVESCDKALDATGTDAEKHPAGFKQLEFSLRDSLRRLDSVLANLTSDEQAPFLDIRKELGELNRHLMEHLFPRGLTDGAEHK
jgi:hypothetical protein